MDGRSSRLSVAIDHVAAVVIVLATWWLIFGRLTPFPRQWNATPSDPHGVQGIAAAGAVVVLAAAFNVLAPRRPRLSDSAILVWTVVSVVSSITPDGDWIPSVPLWLVAAVVLLAVADVIAVVIGELRDRSGEHLGDPKVDRRTIQEIAVLGGAATLTGTIAWGFDLPRGGLIALPLALLGAGALWLVTRRIGWRRFGGDTFVAATFCALGVAAACLELFVESPVINDGPP